MERGPQAPQRSASSAEVIELTGRGLEPADVVALAREGAVVALGDSAREAMRGSAAIVEQLVDSDEPAYGSRAMDVRNGVFGRTAWWRRRCSPC